MLDDRGDDRNQAEVATAIGRGGGDAHVGTEPGWQEIDRALRRVAVRRGGLDAEELAWLARAERAEVHRHVGSVSMLAYVERVLGYGPRVAKERLRVARVLATLPALTGELRAGGLSYSAVRELSRVATPATEAAWIEAARGRVLREIEAQVAGRSPGDRPEDPGDPDLTPRTITLELLPATLALFREAMRLLEDEVGHPLTDDALIAAMCSSVLDAPCPRGHDRAAPGDASLDASAPADEATTRAPYQIGLTVCARCDRAWHDAAGRAVDVPPATLAQARCHADHLGHLDAAVPARVVQDIPPAVQRLVKRRDRGCCTVPGCRSTRFLQLHHVHACADGGGHEPSNITCLCFAHHRLVHEGRLAITGAAPGRLVYTSRDLLIVTAAGAGEML